MTRKEYEQIKLEKKLWSANIQEVVYTELLLEDFVYTLDYACYTKDEINKRIRRLNNVRKEIARLNNTLHNSDIFRATRTTELKEDTKADELINMYEEFKKIDIAEISF